MPLRAAPFLVLLAITSRAVAQEATYSEDRIAPSRVPPSFTKTAEKEAPGVRFSRVYKDNEKDYRFVGQAADGKTFSVKLDRDGKLVWRRIYADIQPAKLPKAVATTFKDEIARNKELSGFQPERTSLVSEFNALKNESSSYYETFGHTPAKIHPRIEVDTSGKLLRVDTSFTPSTSDYTKRESLTAANVPPAVRQGIAAVAPGIRLARVFRTTTKGSTDVNYEAFGRIDGRGVEVWTGANGHAYILAVSIRMKDVPRAALDAVAAEARTEKKLEGFRPREAWKLRLLALDEDSYQFFGDGADGEPLDVRVDAKGQVLVMVDDREVLREEAGISSPEPRPKDAVATRGFAVLAARYGAEDVWLDITETVRTAAAEDKKEFQGSLPDPAYGRRKTKVLLYAMDGKVGLSEAADEEALPLDIRQDASTLAPIPARGFAVLAARYGDADQWEDVTAAVRSRIADGRLDFKPSEANFPDPAPNVVKALAVAYSVDGKVGLHVQAQGRATNLPPDAAPVNSDSLLARSLEFPQRTSTVAFTPDGRNLVLGVEDGSIRVIDANSGREARRFDGHGQGRVVVAISSNGSLIASGGADKVVRLWDVKTEREKAIFRGHTDAVFRIAIAPTGRYVASSSHDNTVRLWDATTGGEVRKFEGHTDFVDGVKFTPDGRQLVTSSFDGSVRIWDVATGRELRKTQASQGKMGELSISKSGRDILYGSDDGYLRWWEPASKRDPVVVPTFAECGWASAALPDGHRALISDKIAVALWDCKTGHPVLRLEKHTGRVTGITISPNGRLAATCGEDRTLKIWKLPDLGR